jgi:hypothetical protein
VEFEKNKKECTFRPRINQVDIKQKKSSPHRTAFNVKGVEKTVARHMVARERQEELRYIQESGKFAA